MHESGKDSGAAVTSLTPAPRIGALANLPVFLKLGGKRGVVAGGNDAAFWKAELLEAAGARVEVYATEFTPQFEAAAADPKRSITVVRRRWIASDLVGAAVAICAAETDEDATAFAKAARAGGAPVNIIDRPALCDFQFGAIVNRSPLVVAISTDGAAPVFAQAVRSIIEGLLPPAFALWADAARSLRSLRDHAGTSAAANRRFWERFTNLAISSNAPPTDQDIVQLLEGPADAQPTISSVTIIAVPSAGIDALTLASVRALRTADHIFSSAGVPPQVLDFARREAPRSEFSLTDTPHMSAIAATIIAATKLGRRPVVVQLQSDEPELVDALKAAGLTFKFP